MYFPLTLLCGCESNHSQATPPPSPRQRYSVTLRPHAWMCSMTTMMLMLTALLSSIKKEILKELYASELKCMYYFGVVNRWCIKSSLKCIYAQMQHQSSVSFDRRWALVWRGISSIYSHSFIPLFMTWGPRGTQLSPLSASCTHASLLMFSGF